MKNLLILLLLLPLFVSGQLYYSSGGSTTTDWVPPSDWIDISSVNDNEINILNSDIGNATSSFYVTTRGSSPYTINWGDGTVLSYASGDSAQHTYVVGSGQVCSRGYTTFKTVISSASDILSFRVAKLTTYNQNNWFPILWSVFGTRSIKNLNGAFNLATTKVICPRLEAVYFSVPMDSLYSTKATFNSCRSLQKVQLASSMDNDTTMASCFSSTVSLETVIFPTSLPKMQNLSTAFSVSGIKSISLPDTMPLLNNISSICAPSTEVRYFKFPKKISGTLTIGSTFGSTTTSVIETIILPDSMPNVTTFASLFTASPALSYVYLPKYCPSLTTLTSMFSTAYSLRTIDNLEKLGSTTVAASAVTMFNQAENLKQIKMNTNFSAFGAPGASGKLNQLSSLVLSNRNSTWSGSSPQIDISYTSLGVDSLEAVFDRLPSFQSSAKVINITGSIGATYVTSTSCTTTIGSTTVTCANTTGLVAGMQITGTGISTSASVTFSDAGDYITRTDHGIPDGTPVAFSTITFTTGITKYTPYYVVNADINSFQVALTPGGSPIALTTDGNGLIIYPTYIMSITPNTSFVISIPANTNNGGATMTSTVLKRHLATLKNWSVAL